MSQTQTAPTPAPELFATRRPTRRLAQKMSRKNNPLDPSTLTLGDCLYVLTGDKAFSQAIHTKAEGKISNLNGLETYQLQALPGVGEFGAYRMIALFEIIRKALADE